MLNLTDVSERRACQLVEISRTVLHYVPKVQPENEQLQGRMAELASERRHFGYRRIHALLRREGIDVNHKRIFRLYQAAGLAVKRRRKRCNERLSVSHWHCRAGQTKYGRWISSVMRWPMADASKC